MKVLFYTKNVVNYSLLSVVGTTIICRPVKYVRVQSMNKLFLQRSTPNFKY